MVTHNDNHETQSTPNQTTHPFKSKPQILASPRLHARVGHSQKFIKSCEKECRVFFIHL